MENETFSRRTRPSRSLSSMPTFYSQPTLHNRMDFDENDFPAMDAVAQSIVSLVSLTFPESISIGDKVLTRVCTSEADIEEPMFDHLLEIIDKCMGKLYVKHKGANWKEEKLDEWAEPGLVFVWYKCEEVICGFIAFKLVLELYGKTLYLYEIQILPEYQGKRLGSELMTNFHRIAVMVNAATSDTNIPVHALLSTKATSLTVFSDNAKALAWYTRIGYYPSPDCDTDRKLRGGKVVKPSFYLLTRPLD